MKLIIDIPGEMYDWLLHGFPDEDDVRELVEAIKNGKPLYNVPKRIMSMETAENIVKALPSLYPLRAYEQDALAVFAEYRETDGFRDTAGKWINADGSTNSADCSCCGSRGKAWMKYCYICGAKMEVGE